MENSGEVRTFPASCAVHSPTHSGIRATADMGDYVKMLYEVPGPFIVIEDGPKFTGITWTPWNPRIGHTKPDIEIHQNRWRIRFPADVKVREYPWEKTLLEAVSHYRREHPPRISPGRPTLERIRRAVFLDLWLVDGRIAHNYADAVRLLNELEQLHLAEGTLLYLMGWHAPYDTRMPAWAPADALGSRRGFDELVKKSRALGGVVMPHINFWGYDKASGLLDDWEEVWTGHRWTGNTGLCPGYPIEYMQIDHPRWVELFDRYFDRTVGEFGLDAVFLDQCGNAVDSPKGDMVSATRSLLTRIHSKFPDLLLGAEVLSEHIVDEVPLIQSCWLMRPNIGKFSPITRLMFEGRIRFFPHLFLAAAHPCRYVYANMPLIVEEGLDKVFYWYQENNRRLGGIPSVRLDYNRYGVDIASRTVLRLQD